MQEGTEYIKVRVSDINMSDRSWKISRDMTDGDLADSIRKYGILDPPVVIKRSAEYELVSGFNRVGIALDSGIKKIDVISCSDFRVEDFHRIFFLKAHRNEVGPVGRMKAVHVMIHRFGMASETLLSESPSLWGVPEDFIFDRNKYGKLMELDKGVLDYIDAKNAGFKYIRMLSALPPDVTATIGEWALCLPMRINIFRQIVEMIYETVAREKSFDFFFKLKPDLSAGKKEAEDYLFNSVFRLRYPEISSVLGKASDLSKKISAGGVVVDFPETVERDYVTVSLKLGRNSSVKSRLESVKRLEPEISELLNLL